jgi:hypothetical protein
VRTGPFSRPSPLVPWLWRWAPCVVGDIVYTSCSPEKFADSFKKKEKKVFYGVVSAEVPIVPQRSAPCRGKDSGTVCGARGSLPSRLTRGLIGHAFIASAGKGTKISFPAWRGSLAIFANRGNMPRLRKGAPFFASCRSRSVQHRP